MTRDTKGRRNVKRRICGGLALCALSTAMLGTGTAHAGLTNIGGFGGSGTGAGQFSPNEFGPAGIAYSEFNDHVYVADPGQHRVQEFDATGNFVRMWGQNVNQTQGTDVCEAGSGDVCKAGAQGGIGGAFNDPQGVAVNDSTGEVYVQDAGNYRIQRFSAAGQFISMWGRAVNSTTGGNLCTAASGNTCVPGIRSGDNTTSPKTPTVNGGFAGWEQASGSGIAIDDDGFVYVTDPRAVSNIGIKARVQKFDPSGTFVSQIASENIDFFDRGLNFPQGIDVAPNGEVFVIDESFVKRFHPDDFSPDGLSAAWDEAYAQPDSVFEGVRQIAVDPFNGFLFVGTDNNAPCPGGGPSGNHVDEYHPSGQLIDCTITNSPLVDNSNVEAGMAVSLGHRVYLGARNSDLVQIYESPYASPPDIANETATEITSKGARLGADVAANIGDTTYHVEYGPDPCSSNPCASTPESNSIGAALSPEPVSTLVEGLDSGVAYYYRFVATNSAGTTEGPDLKFATFPSPTADNSCPNNLARQQSRAGLLLDCRSYELVSAESTGGYNVESDLVPGQTPFGGFPLAEGRVLYAVHDGGIPGTGKPTNHGPDPYVATRDQENGRWNTKYVGIPADVPSDEPFSSSVAGADSGLGTMAFGGPEFCDPCFGDGSAGIPVRTPDGDLIQGMAGSIPVADPEPAGEVRKQVSADGSHLIFGSRQQFEPDGNDNGTDVTIYSRDLEAGTTQVVSKMPSGNTMTGDVVELDVSDDGSRVLLGIRVGEDAEGNDLFDLYMHIGTSTGSVGIAETPTGVAFNGMSADGTDVYYSTADSIGADTDTSVDLFRADVTPSVAPVERVSTGSGGTGNTDACDPAGNSYNDDDWNTIVGGPTDCSVVAIGGGGGVASDGGAIYFLSPEKLDGEGVEGAPNLFLGRAGQSPQFVATLESSASTPLKPSSHVFEGYFGSYGNPEGAAMDPVTGASYILDPGLTVEEPGAFVEKVSASGAVDTSFGANGRVDGTGSPTGPMISFGNGSVLGLPVGIPNGIAVDTFPGSPNYRDIYIPDVGNGVVNRYSSSGQYEAQILPPPPTFPNAVAVNPSNGNVMIAGLFGTLRTYTPAGAATTPTISGQPQIVPGDLAIDTTGKIYYALPEEVRIFDSAGTETGKLGTGPAFGVDVDPDDNHVYVNRADRVIEYDETGAQVGGPIGVGVIHSGVGVTADAGRVVAVSNADGKAARFTAPITPPDRGYDNPLVIDSVRDGEVRRTADFQTNAGGDHAVFPSSMPLTGFESDGRHNVYRFAADGGQVECVSCNTTLATPSADATLASDGLSITDDGRVFFTSAEPLVLRDNNSLNDAYEWSDLDGPGRVELISTGKDTFDSGVLTVTADGTDAYFFTRETLVPQDQNGNLMKIYDARENGGFFTIPPPPPCKASDECHGPGTQPASPPVIGTLEGNGGNHRKPAKRCKKGFVKKKNKCVKKKPKKKSKHKKKAGR